MQSSKAEPNLMETIAKWILLVFAILLSVLALSKLWPSQHPNHTKIVYTIIIVCIPIAGSLIYLHQEDANEESAERRRRRR